MRQPPAFANWLLTRFGYVEESLLGDIYQEWSNGRSGAWFWYETIAAICLGTVREVRRRPARVCAAIASGWIVAAIIFAMGDALARDIAWFVFRWRPPISNENWHPFVAAALVVSYGGFGVSAWFVARLNRRYPAMLVAYAALTSALLTLNRAWMEFILLGGNRVLPVIRGVPSINPLHHPTSAVLPMHWSVGIILVPVTMLLCGALAIGRPSHQLLSRFDSKS